MGDTSNPRIWEGAVVYTAPLSSTKPTDVTTAWAAAWKDVGLLHDETGMVEARSQTTNDYYAWGDVLVRTTRSKGKRTIKFAMLEDNDIVWGIVNPGSSDPTTSGGVTTRVVKVPTSDIRMYGFELSDGTTIKRRVIDRAEIIDVADIEYGEDKMTMYEVTLSVYPVDGVLWRDIENGTYTVSA